MPKELIANESKTVVESPNIHFHADVIRRSKQYILTIRDHFSSFQDAIFIKSEKAEDLRDGLIILTSSIRRPDKIFITVDNSPGFKSLMTREDAGLIKLMIVSIKADELR